MKRTSPIQGAVVGHYFTLYDGVSKQKYQKVVAAAPFQKCNLLILAFVGTFTIDRSSNEGGPIHVVQVANGRDPGTFAVNPNDTDGDRIKLIVETARKKNPSINILISLGYNNQDLEKAASTPVAFADSVRGCSSLRPQRLRHRLREYRCKDIGYAEAGPRNPAKPEQDPIKAHNDHDDYAGAGWTKAQQECA